MNNKMWNVFDKVGKVIESCETQKQIITASNMSGLFYNKYRKWELFMTLHEYSSEKDKEITKGLPMRIMRGLKI